MASNHPELDEDLAMSTSESDHDYEPAIEEESEYSNNETGEPNERLMPGAWAEDAEDDEEDDGMHSSFSMSLELSCPSFRRPDGVC